MTRLRTFCVSVIILALIGIVLSIWGYITVPVTVARIFLLDRTGTLTTADGAKMQRMLAFENAFIGFVSFGFAIASAGLLHPRRWARGLFMFLCLILVCWAAAGFTSGNVAEQAIHTLLAGAFTVLSWWLLFHSTSAAFAQAPQPNST